MSNTINNTMNNVTAAKTIDLDFEMIQADLVDILNYINNNKNLDLDKLKELRDNIVQLETILNNVLGDKPKTAKKTAKKTTAKKDKVETFSNDEGKAFYDSLNIGDTFQYAMANGTIITAKKIETKSKSGLSAACEVVSGLDIPEGKTRKRYPNFSKLVKVEGAKTVAKAESIETEPVQNVEKPIEQVVQNVEKPIEQEKVQIAASVETENDLFDDFDFNDIE